MELKSLLTCIKFTAIPRVLLNGQMFDPQVSLMVVIDPMNFLLILWADHELRSPISVWGENFYA